MKEQAIEIHEGTQVFENESMIAVMSNPQQNKKSAGKLQALSRRKQL